MNTLNRRDMLKAGAAVVFAEGVAGQASATAPSGDLLAVVGAQAPYEIIEVRGAKLAITRRGRGRPIVCLHAAGHGSRDFEALTERMGDGYQIIAVDWPGHGRSPPDGQAPRIARYAQLAEGVCNALELDKPVLLGNSLGAAAAILAVANAPERYAGVVVSDSAGMVPVTETTKAIVAKLIQMFQLGVAKSPQFQPAFAQWYRNIVLPDQRAEAQRERIIASSESIAPLLIEAWTGFTEPEADIRAVVPSITLPVWVTWAKHDQTVPWSYCKPAVEKFPRHTLAFFEGGHSPFLEDPDDFAAGFREYLRSIS